jgi:hypothetical protein
MHLYHKNPFAFNAMSADIVDILGHVPFSDKNNEEWLLT